MDTTKYASNYGITGAVPIIELVPHTLREAATQWMEYFKELTLSGNTTFSNRSEDEIKKDEEAMEVLKLFRAKNNPDREAQVWGFMMYDEGDIVKCYWAKYCGKLRKSKREFYGRDKYIQWCTEINTALCGHHIKFKDPLYYYKINDENSKGVVVGNYDVMNSFRVFWNKFFLTILAQYLYDVDSEEYNTGISIEQAHENENGAGEHLEAALADKVQYTLDVEKQTTFEEIEDFLRSFLRPPLNQPISSKEGLKSAGVTYLDVMKVIVEGVISSVSNLRKRLNLSQSVQQKTTEHIMRLLEGRGLTVQDLADYLTSFGTIARDILNGVDNSFKKDAY